MNKGVRKAHFCPVNSHVGTKSVESMFVRTRVQKGKQKGTSTRHKTPQTRPGLRKSLARHQVSLVFACSAESLATEERKNVSLNPHQQNPYRHQLHRCSSGCHGKGYIPTHTYISLFQQRTYTHTRTHTKAPTQETKRSDSCGDLDFRRDPPPRHDRLAPPDLLRLARPPLREPPPDCRLR